MVDRETARIHPVRVRDLCPGMLLVRRGLDRERYFAEILDIEPLAMNGARIRCDRGPRLEVRGSVDVLRDHALLADNELRRWLDRVGSDAPAARGLAAELHFRARTT